MQTGSSCRPAGGVDESCAAGAHHAIPPAFPRTRPMADLSRLTRVLVVEDEALILMDVVQTLEDAHVGQVVSAVSTEEALAVLDRAAFDAAVLDLHLGRN